MSHRSMLAQCATLAALAVFGDASQTTADAPRISGPVTHENLSIYFIHGARASGPVPLTLAEALAKGTVDVRETGSVNQLEIENKGSDEVFVQLGDIVKGGQQDRVLTVSLLLPPKSGKLPIAAYCVEQGRWTKRGTEDATTFASSKAAVPSTELKLAMSAPRPTVSPQISSDGDLQVRPSGQANSRPSRLGTDDMGSRQRDVWANVATAQRRLSEAVGGSVRAPQSASSLQLALENDRVNAARTGFISALKRAGEVEDDIVGYAFAVNGKLSSADIYVSNGLFRKMWEKSLTASATEALLGRSTPLGSGGDIKYDTPPTIETVQTFLAKAESGKSETKKPIATVEFETRDAGGAVFLETRRTAGSWIHRSYLAK